MYYYIFESPSNRAIRGTYQKIREQLGQLGIAGEYVQTSPARSGAELALQGIERGYSTIIAIGQDKHFYEIAEVAVSRAVLGIIPINASEDITGIIGTNSIKDAIESIKQRRVILLPSVTVDSERTIILKAKLTHERMFKLNLILDNKARVFAYCNEVTLTSALDVYIRSVHEAVKKSFFGLFGSKTVLVESLSHFHAQICRITTDPPLPLRAAGLELAQTPVTLKIAPDTLKLIVKRGTIRKMMDDVRSVNSAH